MLDIIPKEIFIEIISWLDIINLIHVSRICKKFHLIVSPSLSNKPLLLCLMIEDKVDIPHRFVTDDVIDLIHSMPAPFILYDVITRDKIINIAGTTNGSYITLMKKINPDGLSQPVMNIRSGMLYIKPNISYREWRGAIDIIQTGILQYLNMLHKGDDREGWVEGMIETIKTYITRTTFTSVVPIYEFLMHYVIKCYEERRDFILPHIFHRYNLNIPSIARYKNAYINFCYYALKMFILTDQERQDIIKISTPSTKLLELFNNR